MNAVPTLEGTKPLPTPESHDEVVELLRHYQLPLERFGVDGAKTTESIYAKVRKQETRFGEYDGQLVRLLPAVARAMVSCKDQFGNMFVLVENEQGIYAKGGMSPLERELFQDYELNALVQRKSRWAVWETMTDGENRDKAMVRGIMEELVASDPTRPHSIAEREWKVFAAFDIHSEAELKRRIGDALSYQRSEELFEKPLEYPGLGTLYTAHTYHFAMPSFLVRMGYATRDEEGKLNLFGWMPADVARSVLDLAERSQRK